MKPVHYSCSEQNHKNITYATQAKRSIRQKGVYFQSYYMYPILKTSFNLDIFSSGESIPLHTKKDTPKYISPMENFWLMANKYKVHDQPDSNVTDQKSSNVTSGKIAVQNLEANVTRSDDDVTTTQPNTTTIA